MVKVTEAIYQPFTAFKRIRKPINVESTIFLRRICAGGVIRGIRQCMYNEVCYAGLVCIKVFAAPVRREKG